ncbi:hypothetical protein KUH03_34785 [Sphingobacterium sp. E70]|uniref:hypothetical protein n=1 Tax=Sphingobacterium sp. E70 TaxID=2853439 RepID=UPI00211BEB83|nr:hypothetical protein [Sphingobacterium sp. E70]ULT24161.1 hypothetical protein KUH03_34785 [Sphingobacterium sp. E70]
MMILNYLLKKRKTQTSHGQINNIPSIDQSCLLTSDLDIYDNFCNPQRSFGVEKELSTIGYRFIFIVFTTLVAYLFGTLAWWVCLDTSKKKD